MIVVTLVLSEYDVDTAVYLCDVATLAEGKSVVCTSYRCYTYYSLLFVHVCRKYTMHNDVSQERYLTFQGVYKVRTPAI